MSKVMYIKSIYLNNFKKFKDFLVEFPEDLSVVIGPNEKGKSTLLSALLVALFYDPKKSNKEIEKFRAWNSDKLYSIKMEIEHNGENIILFKDFENKVIWLKNESTNIKLDTYNSIVNYLSELGLFKDYSLFESTACVKHNQISNISKGKNSIFSHIQELITSNKSVVDINKIAKKINQAITNLTKGLKQPSKYPGEIRKIKDRLDELNKEKDKVLQEINELSKRTEHLNSLKESVAKLQNELKVKKQQYKLNEDFFSATFNINALKDQLKEIENSLSLAKETIDKKEKLEKKLKGFKFVKDITLQKYLDLVSDVKRIKDKLQKQIVLFHERKQNRYLAFYAFVLLLSIIAFFGYYFYGYFEAVYIFGLACAFLLYAFYLHFKAYKSKKIKRNDLKKIKDKLKEKEAVLKKIYDSAQVRNENEFLQKIKEYENIKNEYKRLESKLEGILKGEDLKSIENKKHQVLVQLNLEQLKITDEQKTNPPTKQEQRKLEIEIEDLEKEIEKKINQINKVSLSFGQFSSNSEHLAEIDEEISYLNKKLSYYQRRIDVLNAILDGLSEAKTETLKNHKKKIEEYAKKYLSFITNGKYSHLKITDDFSFLVWSQEKRDFVVPEEELSCGTKDQIYLVARFAILDVLTDGKKIPVLLDDPFHSFDKNRRDKTKQILKDLSERFQIILFTHSDEYKDWGGVVNLNYEA